MKSATYEEIPAFAGMTRWFCDTLERGNLYELATKYGKIPAFEGMTVPYPSGIGPRPLRHA